MRGELILIVEDESTIADVVEHVLQEHGFRTLRANDGNEGCELFQEHAPDVVILDLNLPGLPGLDLFDRMRAARPEVPVIMLTGRSDEVDRVAGLEKGADDYVTKPFSSRELVARVRAILRRVRGPRDADAPLRAGALAVDLRGLTVTCGDRPVRVSHQELRLLECLVRHPARIFSRDVLIDLIYDGATYVTERTIDAQVKRIRKRVAEACPGLDPIRTVYGMGYKLHEELSG